MEAMISGTWRAGLDHGYGPTFSRVSRSLVPGIFNGKLKIQIGTEGNIMSDKSRVVGSYRMSVFHSNGCWIAWTFATRESCQIRNEIAY